MTYLIVGVTVFIAVLIFLNWWGKRPLKYRLNVAQGDYRKYLEVLLYRGYDLGFMIIEAQDRERFIQFSKYIGREKNVGLQCDFPRAPWSERYYDSLKDLLKQRNYECEIQSVEPVPSLRVEDQVDEFLMIDLNQDLDASVALVRLVLLEIFKLDPSDTVTLWFDNVSVRDEKIGF